MLALPEYLLLRRTPALSAETGLTLKLVSDEAKVKGEALMEVPEVAERIGVKSNWVRHAVNFDGMPCIRYNERLWRFHWPTVLAWLQKRR